jgi:hypothetical protein
VEKENAYDTTRRWKGLLALVLIIKEPREIIRSAALLFASLAILAPLTIAQPCGYKPANVALDSIYSGGPDQYSGAVTCADDESPNGEQESPATSRNNPGDDSKIQPSVEISHVSKPADFNREIYFKNKLEFSLDGGCLPINIPLPFDFFSGDPYSTYPLKYTLVPIIGSLRWHMSDIAGPWILRGNWDFQFSGSVTAIPRGPETRYLVYIMGMRRNFVPHNSRTAPYFDVRLGVGNIDAKGPDGVPYAQGQDLTFTFNFGSGVRYNFNSRYAISAGVNYMHISNANLSQHSYDPADKNPWGIINYGINVVGPMVGIDVQLRRQRRDSE